MNGKRSKRPAPFDAIGGGIPTEGSFPLDQINEDDKFNKDVDDQVFSVVDNLWLEHPTLHCLYFPVSSVSRNVDWTSLADKAKH